MKELDLFTAALEKPDPAQRAAYLNEVCGADTDLRARVDRLLELHQGAGNFLQEPMFDMSGAVAAAENQGADEDGLETVGIRGNKLETVDVRGNKSADGRPCDTQRPAHAEPVETPPPPVPSRRGNLLTRNRILSLAASLVLLALVGALATTTWGMRRAEQRRQEAERARDRTRQALDTMTAWAAGDLLSTQKELSSEQRKILTEIMSFYREFATEASDDERARERKASAALQVGLIEVRLGHREEAAAAFRQAGNGYGKLAADFPAVPDYRNSLANSSINLGAMLAGLGKQDEAKQQYRKVFEIKEKLVADFPDVPQYQLDLGGSYCNFGNLVGDRNRPNEGLIWYEKAIRTLTAVYQQHPQLTRAQQLIRNSHWGRAEAYARLGQYSEAISDWDKAVALSSQAEQPRLRAARAMALVQAGKVAEAVAEVAELTKSLDWPAGAWYDFACVYAIAGGKVTDKKQPYADRAMQLLHQAVKAGYTNAAHLNQDPDLDPLRQREDFKTLIRELERKKAAGTEKQP